jgi:AraC-like DNA-binding protein
MLLLIGIAQCLYVMVYLIFRSGKISRGSLPLAYFLAMGLAFTASFLNTTIPELIDIDSRIIWALWSLQFPLSVLLIIQVAQIYKVPSIAQYSVLLIIPLGFLCAWKFSASSESAETWFRLAALITGALSLASLWLNRSMITALRDEKKQKERYWLILALLFVNAAFIAVMLFKLGLDSNAEEIRLTRTLFGLALVYLSSTSLFRIYPQAVQITDIKKTGEDMSISEKSIAKKIEELIYVQKVYQEPSYSRADLARECEAPEAVISKILNLHFNESFPQLINRHRVEDAKNLLLQTDEPVSIIATESGFNSLASFNRAFKDIVGIAPSGYRAKKR